MAKIRLEIRPWLSEAFDSKKSGGIVLEQEIKTGTTVCDLLTQLSEKYQALGEVLFDPQNKQLNGYVSIVINGQLLQGLKPLDTRIKDSDTITLLPFIDGG
ncbi:MoaD/ThiS family protein [Chloroflexota bacterium]